MFLSNFLSNFNIFVNKKIMKMFLNVLKWLIKFALVFMIFFIWLRYAFDSDLQAALISLPCGMIVIALINLLTRNKKETISLKIKEEQEARSMFDNLIQNKNYDFFFQLAKTRHKNVKKNRICTIIENEEGKIMIYPYLKMKALDKDCALSIYISANKQKIAKVVICAQTIEKDVENFCKNLSIDIVLLDQYDCYQYLFKEYDFFPQQTHIPSSSSKYKQIFGYAFNRSRAKGYAISAMLLLAISFFIRQNLYYCIVATILLLFALLSTLQSSNTRENLKKI